MIGRRLMLAEARRKLENGVEPWPAQHVGPTLDGDPESALSLIVAVHSYKRGELAKFLWKLKIPVPAFREVLSSVWGHDHRYLIDAAGSRRRLRSMFRYAAFPIPDHLPGQVCVWRGTYGLTDRKGARGLSWTTDRGCACWFATRYADRHGRPRLFRAVVPREAIMLFTDDRRESETVIFDIGQEPAIDGAPAEWEEVGSAWHAELNRQSL